MSGTVLALVSISVHLIISSTSEGTYYAQNIDPRILKVTNGFAIDSNLDVYSVIVEDEIQGLLIRTSKNNDGFIQMDDPLPILQKLFTDKISASVERL